MMWPVRITLRLHYIFVVRRSPFLPDLPELIWSRSNLRLDRNSLAAFQDLTPFLIYAIHCQEEESSTHKL